MANKKQSNKGNWNGFFSHYLSEEEKAGIRLLADNKKGPGVGSYIDALVKQNYKVSVSSNEQAGTIVASVTGKQGSLNDGWTLTINHIDAVVAIMAVWFVVSEIYQWGEWPVEESQAPNW